MNTFSEKQRFNQPLIYIVLAMVLFTSLTPLLLLAQQDIDNQHLDFIMIVSMSLPLLIICFLLFVLQLRTQIDRQGIHYGFFPFKNPLKLIPWREIESCEVIQYSPLRDYGGWGYRYGRKGKALNVRGNQGIKITLVGGKNLLIGTQKPQEAQQAIARYFIR